MKFSSLSLASIGTAIVASVCCIGPLVAVVLGLGTFGAAAILDEFRPYLLGVTGLLLAGAFYLAYRPQKVEGCADGVCPPTRRSKGLLWIASALVVLFSTFPYYSPLVWDSLAQGAKPAPFSAPVSSLSLDVEGMTCAGCAATIKASISKLKGVSEVLVSFEDKTATVKYDAEQVTPEQVILAVESAGYKAAVSQ